MSKIKRSAQKGRDQLQSCLRHKQTKLRSMPIWNPVSEYQLSLWWTARKGGSGHLRVLCSPKFGQVNYQRQLSAACTFLTLNSVSHTSCKRHLGKDDAQHDWSNSIMNPPRQNSALNCHDKNASFLSRTSLQIMQNICKLPNPLFRPLYQVFVLSVNIYRYPCAHKRKVESLHCIKHESVCVLLCVLYFKEALS